MICDSPRYGVGLGDKATLICRSTGNLPVVQLRDVPSRPTASYAQIWSLCPKWVKTGKAHCEDMFSALLPRADIAHCSRHVCFVPTTEVTLSLDHLVGDREKRPRDREAERRSLERPHGLAQGLVRGF